LFCGFPEAFSFRCQSFFKCSYMFGTASLGHHAAPSRSVKGTLFSIRSHWKASLNFASGLNFPGTNLDWRALIGRHGTMNERGRQLKQPLLSIPGAFQKLDVAISLVG
jgi:hypothetical protein